MGLNGDHPGSVDRGKHQRRAPPCATQVLVNFVLKSNNKGIEQPGVRPGDLHGSG